jgi:serine protease AprX
MSSYGRAAAAALGAAILVGAPMVTPVQAAVPAQDGLLPDLSAVAPLAPVAPAVGLPTPAPSDSWRSEGAATSLQDVREAIGADALLRLGHDGTGVGVALLDTGVAAVDGLGSVVDGPDLSFESQAPGLAHLDTFGHGTHMAGIIAGADRTGPTRFRGVAPGARLTSLKVASADGAVDVSQVVAGVDWVVAHRDDDPAHPIRVLNLSYGTGSVQDYRLDPLTHAVENAWRAGIVVVVAGGNEGDSGKLADPAYDPYVIAVGAADTHGTARTSDDTVPDFSARGAADRRVDLVAPGTSVVSLRDPGSTIDQANPQARVDGGLFKGSGTSQAAAVVSGAVALLLDLRPQLTPDQVKAVLTRSASPLPRADRDARGAGELDVLAASLRPTPRGEQQDWPVSTGTGSLEAARGGEHVADGDVELTGEQDVLGPWDAQAWARASSEHRSWVGGRWNGRLWTGDCACDAGWAGPAWSVVPWEGRSWAGRSWAGRSWAGRSWAGRSWAGRSWATAGWSSADPSSPGQTG